MTRLASTVILLLVCNSLTWSQEKVSVSFKEKTLKESLELVTRSAGYDLTLGNHLTDKKLYSKTYLDKSLTEILTDLLKYTGMDFTIRNKRVIIFIKEKKADQHRTYTISGYITDSETGEELIGANIYSGEDRIGCSTNEYGFYSISLPSGDKNINFSYVGYEVMSRQVSLYSDTSINISLSPVTELETVVITGNHLERIEQKTQMSSIELPVKELNMLPVVGGEVDIIKTLQLMPGVQSGNEGFAGLYVRGGSVDQNLILLDGVPIYNASHLFGLFSIFNNDAIKSTELIKGGYPARYGGRLSSILDIRMKEGNMQEWGAQGSVGLISSKLTVEGPVIKDKMSLMVSGRRTYIDLLAKPFIRKEREKNGEEGVPGYYFADFMAKANYRISESDRIFLSVYLGGDYYADEIKQDITIQDDSISHQAVSIDSSLLNWGNKIFAFRWNHQFNHKLFSNTTITSTKYKFNVGVNNREVLKANNFVHSLAAQKYSSDVFDITGRIDFDYIYSPTHTFRFGVEGIKHRFVPGVTFIKEEEDGIGRDTTAGGIPVNPYKGMAYLEDDINISERMGMSIGVNASAFSVNNKTYYNVEPRLMGRFRFSPSTAIKGSYTVMNQYLHLLSNSGLGLPTDLWLPPTEEVPPQRSWQTGLGMAHTTSGGVELSVEGYYKSLKNLISYKEGASFLYTNNDWESKVTLGEGRSYGVEVFINKKFGRLRGWIGYTLSYTDRQFDEVNFGKRFPFKFDRRHDFSLVANYRWRDNLHLGLNLVYGSGNAVTLPVRKYEIAHEYFFHTANEFTSKNSYRQRPYHRMDLSFSYFKGGRQGRHSFHINIYNVYNRRNTFYIRSNYETINNGDFREFLEEVTLLPIIPSFRWDFKF